MNLTKTQIIHLPTTNNKINLNKNISIEFKPIFQIVKKLFMLNINYIGYLKINLKCQRFMHDNNLALNCKNEEDIMSNIHQDLVINLDWLNFN